MAMVMAVSFLSYMIFYTFENSNFTCLARLLLRYRIYIALVTLLGAEVKVSHGFEYYTQVKSPMVWPHQSEL